MHQCAAHIFPPRWAPRLMPEIALPAGVYIIGCQRLFSADNNIVISRMADGSGGADWSPPVVLTKVRRPFPRSCTCGRCLPFARCRCSSSH